MPEIPEEQQAAALRAVAEIGEKRAKLLEEAERLLTNELRPAAVHAAQIGAQRSRIRELARVSPGLFYNWLEAAGLEVRAKKPRAAKPTTA